MPLSLVWDNARHQSAVVLARLYPFCRGGKVASSGKRGLLAPDAQATESISALAFDVWTTLCQIGVRVGVVLLMGAIVAPEKRTVSAILRAVGLQQDPHFQTDHRVLSRALWSSRQVSRPLCSNYKFGN